MCSWLIETFHWFEVSLLKVCGFSYNGIAALCLMAMGDNVMKILITGGTGFIGSALTRSLTEQGYEVTVLSRNSDTVEKICGSGIKALNNLNQLKPEDSWQVIINLAGAPIFDARWSDARKQVIRDSRISLTRAAGCVYGPHDG